MIIKTLLDREALTIKMSLERRWKLDLSEIEFRARYNEEIDFY